MLAHAHEASGKIIKTRRAARVDNYIVSYRFVAPNREGIPSTFIGANLIRADSENGISAGREIPILFDPSDPRESMLNVDGAARRYSPWSKLAKLVELMIPAYAIFATIISVTIKLLSAKERRLLRTGVATPSTIIEENEYSHRFQRMSAVTYSFMDQNGIGRQGIRKWVPLANDQAPSARRSRADILANPTVVFDPNDSNKNLLYPGLLTILKPVVISHPGIASPSTL